MIIFTTMMRTRLEFLSFFWSSFVTKIALPPLIIENEIDGDSFLALKDDMIKTLIPKIGPQSKFLVKHKKLLDTLVSTRSYLIPW